MHGLAKESGYSFGESVGQDVISAWRSRLPEFEGPIEDSGAPCAGKIAQIAGVLCLALTIALLDKHPKALAIDEKVATLTMVIGNKGNCLVICYPFGEPRELRRVIQVSVRKHGVVRK
jgi:hypothetical protein